MPFAPRRLLVILAALSLAAILFALTTGSGPAGTGTLRALVAGSADGAELDILLRLRLPRALAAFGTGAALAVAGALMQVLLRNPLADPYVLGTSGGAAVGALGAMLLGAAGLSGQCCRVHGGPAQYRPGFCPGAAQAASGLTVGATTAAAQRVACC